jgi:hypothetical protein
MEIREAHLANSEAIFTLKAKCDSQQVCGFLKMDASQFNEERFTKSFQDLLDDFSKKAQTVLLEARIKEKEELLAELNPEKFQAKTAELWVEECRCLGSDVNTLDQCYSITEEMVADSDDEYVSDCPSESINGRAGRPVHTKKMPLSAYLYSVAAGKIKCIVNSKIDEQRSAWARRAEADRAKKEHHNSAVLRASDAAPMEADCSILQEVSSMLQMGFQEQRTKILEELHKMLECKQPSGGEHEKNGGKRKNEFGAARLTHGGPTTMESRTPKRRNGPILQTRQTTCRLERVASSRNHHIKFTSTINPSHQVEPDSRTQSSSTESPTSERTRPHPRRVETSCRQNIAAQAGNLEFSIGGRDEVEDEVKDEEEAATFQPWSTETIGK